jgi:F-type H+-transporting ATPase subunit alpha
MKKVAGRLKLSLAQFAELESFSQFSSDLDPATRRELARGKRLREILKQAQNSPIPVQEQIVIIYSGINGFLDEIPLELVSAFMDYLRNWLKKSDHMFLLSLKYFELSGDEEVKLRKIIENRKMIFLTQMGSDTI